MDYVQNIISNVVEKNPGELEFHQAVKEVLSSVKTVFEKYPEYEKAGILERLVEPERQIMFRVPWIDDEGKISE